MGKLNQEVVEMKKLINRSPIDSFWVYWETDLTFTIVGSVSTIIVRTDDRTLTNAETHLITGSDLIPIPIGTYSIGTYSIPVSDCEPIPVEEFGKYTIIVGTEGYITEVLSYTQSMDLYSETKIPNIGEESVEWIAKEHMLRPIIKDIAKGGYAIGATYSSLIRRGNF